MNDPATNVTEKQKYLAFEWLRSESLKGDVTETGTSTFHAAVIMHEVSKLKCKSVTNRYTGLLKLAKAAKKYGDDRGAEWYTESMLLSTIDAAFIAGADPQTIIGLIEDVSGLESKLANAVKLHIGAAQLATKLQVRVDELKLRVGFALFGE